MGEQVILVAGCYNRFVLSAIEQHRSQIEALCRRHRVRRLELFGSAVRGDFKPGTSDFDFLVEFEPMGWQGSSDRYFGLLHGLEDLFGTRIDLVTVGSVTSPIFSQIARKHCELLYAA